jgi:hypothetical protein
VRLPVLGFVVETPDQIKLAQARFGREYAAKMEQACNDAPTEQAKRHACLRLLREFERNRDAYVDTLGASEGSKLFA